jgi:hypothetical protein
MSKQDRVAVRNAADLERKYQFGKQFSEIMGLVNDARDAAYEVESDLRSEILEQYTSLTRNTEEMVFEALKSYTETSDLEELAKTLRAEFSASADGIYAMVSAIEESVKKVDGDLQSKYNLITKYFTFDINGLLIGALDAEGNPSPNKVIIDNDEITIKVGNTEVIRFDANGNALTPTLKVEKSINVVGLLVTEDDTHINCAYIGG